MTTYKVISPLFVAVVHVSSGIVVQTAPVLEWTLNRDWPSVLENFKHRGWTVAPVLDDGPRTTHLTYDGVLYEFHWSDKRCIRITRHQEGCESEDITADELPDELLSLI